ncbi:MAG: CinA family protein [Kiritimatiellia bacterium]
MSGSSASRTGRRLRDRGETVAVAESCTGGMLGARVTAVSGSSAWFLGGVIVYSNVAKIRLLGVSSRLLAARGAVSEETAKAMARGVRRLFGATYGMAITGIAGPGGSVPGKPAGTVCLAVAGPRGSTVVRRRFPGGRGEVRRAACQKAIEMLDERLGVVA